MLTDDGTTTISITGNALDDSDEDWYLISTSDVATESSTWSEDYAFEAVLVEGDSTYEIEVFDADVSLTTDVCAGSSYWQFDWYFQDPTWGNGRVCYPGTNYEYYTDCPDFTTDWYIKVTRRGDADPSCDQYEMEITNGMW